MENGKLLERAAYPASWVPGSAKLSLVRASKLRKVKPQSGRLLVMPPPSQQIQSKEKTSLRHGKQNPARLRQRPDSRATMTMQSTTGLLVGVVQEAHVQRRAAAGVGSLRCLVAWCLSGCSCLCSRLCPYELAFQVSAAPLRLTEVGQSPRRATMWTTTHC